MKSTAEVTTKGVFNAKGERVPVGESVTFESEDGKLPAYLVGKAKVTGKVKLAPKTDGKAKVTGQAGATVSTDAT